MVKINTVERIVITITIVFVSFTIGFFIGRTTGTDSIYVEAAVPTDSTFRYVDDGGIALENSSDNHQDCTASVDKEQDIWSIDSNEKLDLNKASQEELLCLPGIGEVLSNAIIEYRDSIGGFSNPDQLLEVDGIGERTYNKIQQYVKVEE